ncbi:MAG TPA: GNAT family N-acetyltransferase [Bryobacteraceae bacterium]|nr:GNAT family N-acetyltransferase [Bryobacteraceae bacterium]
MPGTLAAFALPLGELRDGDLELRLKTTGPHGVHKVPAYRFRMVHRVSGEELGQINLRIASTRHIEMYAGHIGYSVLAAHRGHRYAARSVRLLLPLARSHGLDPLWITCDPENFASRRTLELAGAEFVEVVSVPKDCVIHQNGHLEKCRYRLPAGASQDLPQP